jgi:Zn-dependent peptidase ImmA (M78 family)
LARECAKTVIDQLWIQSVDEIDLHEIAWRVGKLVINESPMNNCEGRLVTDGETGIIRVNNEIVHSGRQRFTISHEIGHFCLNHHKRKMFESHYENYGKNNDGIEAEANHFASELLMPSKLIQKTISGIIPEVESLIQLSEAYQTSILATALKFIELTSAPCLLLCIDKAGKIKWHKKSRAYSIPFYRKRIDKNSLASYVLQTKEGIRHCENVPKEMWLGKYNRCSNIKESAYFVNQTNEVISLLSIE